MPKNSVEDLRARGIPVADIQRANEEQKLESFIEALPIAVFVTDAKGRRCHSNQLARELLRHTSLLAEDAGQVVENFEGFIENTDERYPHEQLPIVRALLGISCSIDDLEIQHAGRRIPVEVHGAPILNGRGEVIFAVASFTDITERKSLETRLRIADRMASVGTLAAGVAHEINNPLAYVMANLAFVVEELRRDFGGMAEVIEALDEARAGAERVRVIVRDLKTFSRQHQDELVPVDVRKVLEASVSIAWNEIRHRARLVKLLADVPDVMASEARLGQVCLNLLVNAAQALPVGAAEKNEIRLTTSLEAGRVVIEVADTGPGIPPEVLSRIFDPFFTTKAAGVGTGLGLSICRSIVQSLGGELRVETRLGEGTRFRVLLAATEATRPEPKPRRAAVPGAARCVLIVDDEPMIGRALKRILGASHEVIAASTGKEALALIGSGKHFDVLLCDLMMPEMTGMDLYRVLLDQRPDDAQRMVFLSGGAFTEDARIFLDEVSNVRLEKPFDPQTLRDLIDRGPASGLLA